MINRSSNVAWAVGVVQRRLVAAFCLLALSLCGLRTANAGGGPENVLLLVNANSDSSKAIANFYIELRKIPPSNVLYIDWKWGLETCSGVGFRDKIVQPILATLDERHLTRQIDYVLYSTDFPWRVELQNLFPDHKFEIPFDPVASITGATYLLPFVLNKQDVIVQPGVNFYVPRLSQANMAQCTELANVPSRGFRSQYSWDPEGEKAADPNKGQRYLLSTVLGVTQGRGNTEKEIHSYLQRAMAADFTRPQGTIYYMWNKDIRSATRDKCFPAMAAAINALGVPAKVQQGILPDGAKDVTGLMVGAADFDLAKSGIVIRPGAICEHLTSAGGILSNTKFQTPLSEFLRHGAAGASGAVTEPRAIQAKFPLPSLQLHYARGCSLAESFYQSISGPYQLLIVGDALCQPWANPPKVLVAGIKANDVVKGKLSITPSGVAGGTRPIGTFEIFIDGRLVARSTVSGPLDIDTTKMTDGYHELRIVGSSKDAIETQGRLIMPFVIRNHDAVLEVKAPATSVNSADKFKVSVKQTGAKAIVVRQNNRELGRVQGEAGEVEIAAATLGRGTSMLQAFSEGDVPVISTPVRVQVN